MDDVPTQIWMKMKMIAKSFGGNVIDTEIKCVRMTNAQDIIEAALMKKNNHKKEKKKVLSCMQQMDMKVLIKTKRKSV